MNANAITKTNGNVAAAPADGELVSLVAECRRAGPHVRSRLDIPRPVLSRLYVELGMSTLEIGRLLGCSKRTVGQRLRESGIPLRALREAFAISPTHARNNPRCGPKSNFWKGGFKMQTGYLQVMAKDHPDANKRGYVFVHRMVAAEALGRPLRPGEEVHHRNCDRLDNRPENLEVMTKSAHMALHMREKHADGRITVPQLRKGN